jgi:hypothetical protein
LRSSKVGLQFQIIRLAVALLVFAPKGWTLCAVPQPRLLCPEYVESDAVLIAKLVNVQEAAPDGFDPGHIYDFKLSRRLRGQVDSAFQVFEENNSGRASFDWIKGKDYLLFASYSQRARAWRIDGCGNSGPLNRSAKALAAIHSLDLSSKYGIVQGMTGTDSWSTPVPAVAVRASGKSGRVYDQNEFSWGVQDAPSDWELST